MFSGRVTRTAAEVDQSVSELIAMNAERSVVGRAFHHYVVHNFFKSFDSVHVFSQYRSRYTSEYSVVLKVNNATRSDKRYLFDIFNLYPEKRIYFAQEREVSEDVLLIVGARKYVKAGDYTVCIQEGQVEERSLNNDATPAIVYNIRFHHSWKVALESRSNVLLVSEEYGAEDQRALIRGFINTGLAFYIPYYKVNVPRTYENLVSLMFSYEVVGSKREYNGVLVRYLQYYNKALQDHVHRVGYSVHIDRSYVENAIGARFAADLLINYANFERSIKMHSENLRYRDLFLFCDAACRVARSEVTNIPDDQDSGVELDILCAIYVLTCDVRRCFVDEVDDLSGRSLEIMVAFNRHYRTVSVIQTYLNMLSVGSGTRQGIIIPQVVPRLRESIQALIEVFTASRLGSSGLEDIAQKYESGSAIERETIAAISIAAICDDPIIRERLMYIPAYRGMLSTYQKRRDFVRSGCILNEDNSTGIFDLVRNGGVLGLVVAHAVVYEIEQLYRMGYIPTPIGVIPSKMDRDNLARLCDDLVLNASRVERYSNHRSMLRSLIREVIQGVHCAPKVERFVKVYGKNERDQRRRVTRQQQETASNRYEQGSAVAAADNVINSTLEDINAENAASVNRESAAETR